MLHERVEGGAPLGLVLELRRLVAGLGHHLEHLHRVQVKVRRLQLRQLDCGNADRPDVALAAVSASLLHLRHLGSHPGNVENGNVALSSVSGSTDKCSIMPRF